MSLEPWRFRPWKWATGTMGAVLAIIAASAIDSPCESFRVVISNQTDVRMADVAVANAFQVDATLVMFWRGVMEPRQTRVIAIFEPAHVNPLTHPIVTAHITVRWGTGQPDASLDLDYARPGVQAHFILGLAGSVAYAIEGPPIPGIVTGVIEWGRCAWRSPRTGLVA